MGELSESKANAAFSSYSVPGTFKLTNLEAKPMGATAAQTPATAADMMYLVQWLAIAAAPTGTTARNPMGILPASWELLPAGSGPLQRAVTSGGPNLARSVANGVALLVTGGKQAGVRLATGGSSQPSFSRCGDAGE